MPHAQRARRQGTGARAAGQTIRAATTVATRTRPAIRVPKTAILDPMVLHPRNVVVAAIVNVTRTSTAGSGPATMHHATRILSTGVLIALRTAAGATFTLVGRN